MDIPNFCRQNGHCNDWTKEWIFDEFFHGIQSKFEVLS